MNNIIRTFLIFISLCTTLLHAQSINVGDTINSTITYINLHDTTVPYVLNGNSNVDIDVDFDYVNDIRFFRSHSSSPSHNSGTFYIYSLNNIQLVVISGSNNVDTVSSGSIINNSLNWNNHFNGSLLYYYLNSNIPPPWGPPSTTQGICKYDNIYIAFRKIYTNDTLYGWFLIDLYTQFKLKSFAVNQVFSTINETNFKNNFKIFPNPTTEEINISFKLEKSTEVELQLYNSLGQQIKVVSKEKLNAGEFKIKFSVEDVPEGAYFLKIQIGEKTIIRKIIKY